MPKFLKFVLLVAPIVAVAVLALVVTLLILADLLDTARMV
jgi:hypothetical protein